jgi:hypothetical protein
MTFEAITGFASIFAKFFVSVVGFTRSTIPPVSSQSLLSDSMLHSSPSIETRLIVTPLVLAN